MIQWTFATAQNGFKEFTVIKSFSTEFWIELDLHFNLVLVQRKE